jgi:ribosome-associated translation inhibitor RaiA
MPGQQQEQGTMQKALQIHFHGMETSDALEERIRERVAELERRCPDATSCRVTVEKESRHHVKGNLFRVSLVLHRPGHDVVVNRSGPKDHGHEDVYVALRDTFDVATRQIEEVGR